MKSSPLPPGDPVVVPASPQCRYPPMQFAETRGGNLLLPHLLANAHLSRSTSQIHPATSRSSCRFSGTPPARQFCCAHVSQQVRSIGSIRPIDFCSIRDAETALHYLVELRQLRYFIEVARSLSFTQAGRTLHIAQPALSRQIRRLEEEIGSQLLVRDHRKVEITDLGQVFLREAIAVVSRANHAVETINTFRRGEIGTVKIGLAPSLAARMNRALVGYSRRFPDIELQCKDLLSSLQSQALRDYSIDVGFLRPPVDVAYLRSERIFEEQFIVFLSKRNPLARRHKLHLKELAGLPLLLQPRNSHAGMYDKTLELYKRVGITPKIIHTSTGPYEEAGTLLVTSRKGIYLGVGAVRRNLGLESRVVALPLDEPDAKMEVHVAWRNGEESPAVLSFLNSVRRAFKIPIDTGLSHDKSGRRHV